MSKEKYTFEALMEKRAAELKEICDGLGLSTDGNKTELSNRILAEEARLEAETTSEDTDSEETTSEDTASVTSNQPTVVYTLPEKSVGVIDTDGRKYTREEALKNQPLLAKLKKLGHKGIKIKK